VRLTPPALLLRLEKKLDRVYLFFGTELVLIEEGSDKLRQVARGQGVDEIARFTSGIDLDWQRFLADTRSIAMFSNRRIIEIRLPTGKPGKDGSQALLSFLEEDREDIILVVLAGHIDKRSQTLSWFKELEKRGTVVEAGAIPAKKIPLWIENRLLSRGVRSEPGIANRLAFYVEGNLSAAVQEIEKLSLLVAKGEVLTVELLEQSICEQARFSVYQFVDSCLQGASGRALRILNVLRRDGAEPILVIWTLARETRQIVEMASEVQHGRSLPMVLKDHQVWSTRVACVRAAVERHSESYWQQLLRRLSEIDQSARGRFVAVGSSWDQLEGVALSICGITTGPNLSF